MSDVLERPLCSMAARSTWISEEPTGATPRIRVPVTTSSFTVVSGPTAVGTVLAAAGAELSTGWASAGEAIRAATDAEAKSGTTVRSKPIRLIGIPL